MFLYKRLRVAGLTAAAGRVIACAAVLAGLMVQFPKG